MERDIASLYRELMDDPEPVARFAPDIPDDPRRTADEGELESDAPFDSFERRDRLNDREWEEGK